MIASLHLTPILRPRLVVLTLCGICTLGCAPSDGGGGATIPDLNGVWLVAPGDASGAEFAEMAGPVPPQVTAEAQRARDEYDLLTDDPAYRCDPASIVRVWSNPVPIEIEQQSDRVLLRYEYMDAVRTVYLDAEPSAGEPAALGHSVGHYEDSTLVIDTTGFANSYIGSVTGLRQTESLQTTERLTVGEDGQSFRLEILNDDPTTFTTPWMATRLFTRTDVGRLPWECVLEDAGYEEFNEP